MTDNTTFKKKIIGEVARETDMPTSSVDKVIGSFLRLLSNILSNGVRVVLSGFGSFEVRDRTQRMGTNPQTHEKMMIPASRVVRFKSSIILRNLFKKKKETL